MFAIYFFIILFLHIVSTQVIIDIKVKTNEGTVVGFRENDDDYFQFYGIPYGGKTSGEYRFKAAPPPDKYEELIANKKGQLCAQPSSSGLIGDEDCLNLNIFTNNVNTTKPVIVWIAGENFSDTNSTKIYSFKTLVKSDIVLVEVNYRLSVFGFLCLGVEDAPGNAGLKDVIQALDWIKKNIISFGGDPNNVILLGHGSGAAMVDLITLSNQSRDLVHKAIALSGSALSPWAIAYDAVGHAKHLGLKLGLKETENHALAKSLKTVVPEEMVTKINSFELPDQSLPFVPCVENSALMNGFINMAPIDKLKSGTYKAIPYIAGFVTKEGSLILKEALDHGWLEEMQRNFTKFLPVDLKFTDDTAKADFAQRLRKYYFGNQTIDIATLGAFLEYEGESLIKYPMIRTVKERARFSNDSIRLLIFDYQEDQMTWAYKNVSLKGPWHGSLLNYIFDVKSGTFDAEPRQTILNRIVNFAKTGIPSGYSGWFPATPENDMPFVIKGNRLSYGVHIELEGSETIAPWDDIISSYYRLPIPVSSAKKLVFSCLLIVVCQILIRRL